jgi:hypothetical protein
MANRRASPDPRIEELQRMGLQRLWLDVAKAIGVDALLKLFSESKISSANTAAS